MLSVLQHRGAVNSVEVVGVVFAPPAHCAEEWTGEKRSSQWHLRAGWQQQTASAQ